MQAATGEDALLDPSQQTWLTVADNVEEGGFEAACSQLDCCAPGAGGCAFRVRPLDVRGWARPGAPKDTMKEPHKSAKSTLRRKENVSAQTPGAPDVLLPSRVLILRLRS